MKLEFSQKISEKSLHWCTEITNHPIYVFIYL